MPGQQCVDSLEIILDKSMKHTTDDVTIKNKRTKNNFSESPNVPCDKATSHQPRTNVSTCLLTTCVNMHRNPVAEEDKPVRHSPRRVGE